MGGVIEHNNNRCSLALRLGHRGCGAHGRGWGQARMGVGIAMFSIGGLNFPAVWGWPLVAPGDQRI